MAEITQEHIEQGIEQIKAVFADGIQWHDLADAARIAAEFAEVFSLNGDEKKALACKVTDTYIDRWDIPWVPSAAENALVKPILKQIVHGAIETVVQAAAGKFAINQAAPESQS